MLHIKHIIKCSSVRATQPLFQALQSSQFFSTNRVDSVQLSKKDLSINQTNLTNKSNDSRSDKSLVSAAFASLKNDTDPVAKPKAKMTLDERISSATSVEDLLSVTSEDKFSRRYALKIVSTLSNWSSCGKIKLADFEVDSRFQKACRLLGRVNKPGVNNSSPLGDDLSTVLSITGDDEAAKLIASISLPQMVKILSALAYKKRRSTPLLRSLSFHMSKSDEVLNLKECADVLYSASVLNFPDQVMLDKVCNDILKRVGDAKSAVVGSLITSLGRLRYKNIDVINALSEWICQNHENVRPQDLLSYFFTLAILNHQPFNRSDVCEILLRQVNVNEMLRPASWVELVWSLVVLNYADANHITTVLDPNFIEKLQYDERVSISTKMKILNINAAAVCLRDKYKGPLLADTSELYAITPAVSKDKQALVATMLDALKSVLPTKNNCVRTHVDSGMGFSIDAECFLDKNCNPQPAGEVANKNHMRVALMALSYHDLTFGKRQDPNGYNALAQRLLEGKGYRVIFVPHNEFNPKDKLVNKVKYLEKRLKDVVN